MSPLKRYVALQLGAVPGAAVGAFFGVNSGMPTYSAIALTILGAAVTGLAAEYLFSRDDSGRQG